nr:nucleoside phosphorylase [uncultured Desulfobulbus sp.]
MFAAALFLLVLAMDDVLISPRREKNEPTLPPIGLLLPNPAEQATLPALVKEYALKRQFFFNSQLLYNERFFLVGPAVGAPMAAICLEKLVALGARKIVVYGWCGSLAPELRIGELFLPEFGLSEEGTSAHYPVTSPPDHRLQQQVRELLTGEQESPKTGGVWTTDGLYRETRDKVASYAGQGILAVDMEYTALQAVASFRQVQLGCAFLVSDELFGDRWEAGYRHKSFRLRSRQVLSLLIASVHKGKL